MMVEAVGIADTGGGSVATLEPESDGPGHETLLGIGAAAARAGVSERSLRYYQQLGLITPSGRTPGGMRRYSESDLGRVARIRELQILLGLNLEEIAVVLRGEDRLVEIRHAFQEGDPDRDTRRALLSEGLALHRTLRDTVRSKRAALDTFLEDLDGRIARVEALLAETDS